MNYLLSSFNSHWHFKATGFGFAFTRLEAISLVATRLEAVIFGFIVRKLEVTGFSDSFVDIKLKAFGFGFGFTVLNHELCDLIFSDSIISNLDIFHDHFCFFCILCSYLIFCVLIFCIPYFIIWYFVFQYFTMKPFQVCSKNKVKRESYYTLQQSCAAEDICCQNVM